MKLLISTALVGLLALAPGCAYTKISDGQFTATRVTLGNNIAIGHLTAGHGTNSITLEQYSNNQTEALAAVAGAVAAGVVKGAKPTP